MSFLIRLLNHFQIKCWRWRTRHECPQVAYRLAESYQSNVRYQYINWVLAYAWFHMAHAWGHDQAQAALLYLEDRMPIDQLQIAREVAGRYLDGWHQSSDAL